MRRIEIAFVIASSTAAHAQPVDPYQPGVELDPGAPPAIDVDVPDDSEPGEYTEVPARADVYADTDPSALSDFRGVLDPYGAWLDDPTYGTVWVPDANFVGPDFIPYQTAGHWEWDGQDYVWVSDFPWGWVPFHYGRWVESASLGWVWIPGRRYAPAWVDWRVGTDSYDYVGWGPTPPDHVWYDGIP